MKKISFILLLLLSINVLSITKVSATVLKGWVYNEQKNVLNYYEENQIQTNRIVKINSNRYYFDSLGNRYSGWLDLEGYRYYFSYSGQMLYKWQYIDGNWYYFNSFGQLQYNQKTDYGYLGGDGKLKISK